MEVDPPQSRVFVVCGRAIESDVLEATFQPYGTLQNVKLIKDKGVAYVKYEKASSAALAIENLNGAVLNNGRGPKLKVMLAEAPTARGITPASQQLELEISSDPDNVPPRSRLFLVVPKQADAQQIQDCMCQYPDLEYCKTDLISAKGVIFCKFHKTSSALTALEDITFSGTLAGYKVKCMLAEPKTKRRADGSPQDMFGHMSQAAKLEYGVNVPGDNSGLQLRLGAAGLSPHMGMSDYPSLGLGGFAGGLGGLTLSGINNLADMHGLGSGVGLGFPGGLGNLQAGSPVSPNNDNSPQMSKQRLFVVLHKGVSEGMIARLFRRLPGMEYCDLKKDRATGKSKGFCYINYSTPDAAAAAIEQLNGAEFPPHSGHRIKVMYAEPMGVRPAQGTSRNSPSISMHTSPSPVHTPLSRNLSPDVVSVQDTLASMTVQRVPQKNGQLDQVDRVVRMLSPVSSTGALNNLAHASPVPARELMFVG